MQHDVLASAVFVCILHTCVRSRSGVHEASDGSKARQPTLGVAKLSYDSLNLRWIRHAHRARHGNHDHNGPSGRDTRKKGAEQLSAGSATAIVASRWALLGWLRVERQRWRPAPRAGRRMASWSGAPALMEVVAVQVNVIAAAVAI